MVTEEEQSIVFHAGQKRKRSGPPILGFANKVGCLGLGGAKIYFDDIGVKVKVLGTSETPAPCATAFNDPDEYTFLMCNERLVEAGRTEPFPSFHNVTS